MPHAAAALDPRAAPGPHTVAPTPSATPRPHIAAPAAHASRVAYHPAGVVYRRCTGPHADRPEPVLLCRAAPLSRDPRCRRATPPRWWTRRRQIHGLPRQIRARAELRRAGSLKPLQGPSASTPDLACHRARTGSPWSRQVAEGQVELASTSIGGNDDQWVESVAMVVVAAVDEPPSRGVPSSVAEGHTPSRGILPSPVGDQPSWGGGSVDQHGRSSAIEHAHGASNDHGCSSMVHGCGSLSGMPLLVKINSKQSMAYLLN